MELDNSNEVISEESDFSNEDNKSENIKEKIKIYLKL